MTIAGKQITKKFVLKFAGYFAGLLVVLGIGTYIFLIQREKAQFAQAEKEIDTLYAQIVEKVGKPDQEKKTKSCDRPNLKYEKGPLSCFVATYLLYENKNFQESNEFMAAVSKLSNAPLRIGSVSTQGTSFTQIPRRNGDQTFFQNFTTETKLSCTLSYVFPAKEQDEFILKSETGFEIGFDCGGSATNQYYPLKD